MAEHLSLAKVILLDPTHHSRKEIGCLTIYYPGCRELARSGYNYTYEQFIWYWRIAVNIHQPSTHHLCCVRDTSYVSACYLFTRVLTLELHLLKKPPCSYHQGPGIFNIFLPYRYIFHKMLNTTTMQLQCVIIVPYAFWSIISLPVYGRAIHKEEG